MTLKKCKTLLLANYKFIVLHNEINEMIYKQHNPDQGIPNDVKNYMKATEWRKDAGDAGIIRRPCGTSKGKISNDIMLSYPESAKILNSISVYKQKSINREMRYDEKGR